MKSSLFTAAAATSMAVIGVQAALPTSGLEHSVGMPDMRLSSTRAATSQEESQRDTLYSRTASEELAHFASGLEAQGKASLDQAIDDATRVIDRTDSSRVVASDMKRNLKFKIKLSPSVNQPSSSASNGDLHSFSSVMKLLPRGRVPRDLSSLAPEERVKVERQRSVDARRLAERKAQSRHDPRRKKRNKVSAGKLKAWRKENPSKRRTYAREAMARYLLKRKLKAQAAWEVRHPIAAALVDLLPGHPTASRSGSSTTAHGDRGTFKITDGFVGTHADVDTSALALLANTAHRYSVDSPDTQ